jgi:hypothetical protein
MSRVTIDLKKRAKEHTVHYNLSRPGVVETEESPYCYQLSHIRFRDIITGGKSVSKPGSTPYKPASKPSLGNPGGG